MLKVQPGKMQENYIRDKLIFHMLYYCGLRRSELLNLGWDDVNLEINSYFIYSIDQYAPHDKRSPEERIYSPFIQACFCHQAYREECKYIACTKIIGSFKLGFY